MSTPILLDCDPGHDDAIALLLALASNEVELRGVTTVAGNQTLEKTTANAIRVLELVERGDVPVAAGADRPLVREPRVAANVHGETGLDGPDLPPARGRPEGDHAVDFLAGRVAMIWNSTAFLRYLEDNAKFEVGAAALPRDVRASVPTGGTFNGTMSVTFGPSVRWLASSLAM